MKTIDKIMVAVDFSKYSLPSVQYATNLAKKSGCQSQISSRVADGSRSAASDIIEAADRYGCGTIVMGQRGVTNAKMYNLGSVSRKVLQNCKNSALWLVT